MTEYLSYDTESIKNSIQELDSIKLLAFACSCAERIIIATQFWNDEVYQVVRTALDNTWEIIVDPSYSPVKEVTQNSISVFFDQTTHGRYSKLSFPDALPFISRAIETIYYIARYSIALDLDHTLLCSERTFSTYDELMTCLLQRDVFRELTLDDFIIKPSNMQQELFRQVARSEFVQNELRQQITDIDRLRSSLWSTDTVIGIHL